MCLEQDALSRAVGTVANISKMLVFMSFLFCRRHIAWASVGAVTSVHVLLLRCIKIILQQ